MKQLRLIIVEDSEDDTILLLHQLQKAGYDPDHVRVETAEELRSVLENGSWDLIISDHALPCFSAPEALSVLNNSSKDLPFIIVSSVIGEEVAVAAMKAGAHDYIMKNNLARLAPIVERTLYDAGVRAERKKVREALQESEDRFRRLAENAQDLIYRIRLIPEMCYEFISPSVKKFTGYNPDDYYQNPRIAFNSVHPDDRHIFEASMLGKRSFASPLILRWYHKNGSTVWAEHRNVGIYNDQGKLIAIEGISRDITDRILSEKKLKTSHAQIEALSNRILNAMEDERARLARELHDELGQALTAVKLDLQLLGDKLEISNDRRDRLQQTIDLVDYTINLVRRQSVSLRPPALDDMGLLPAIREMVRGFMKRTGINTVIEENGFSRRMSRHVETALYRCVQESLTNVTRHAEAQKVVVEFKQEKNSLWLNIIDDGIGFEPERQKISADSIGLTGMHERIKLLGGEFEIDSSPGEGTRIMIRLPCQGLSYKETGGAEDESTTRR